MIDFIVNSMPAQHIFTTEVKQVVIMMSQTLIKFLMLTSMLTIKGRAVGSSDRKQPKNDKMATMNILESCKKTPLTVIMHILYIFTFFF